MQTIEITGHIYAVKQSWDNETRYEHGSFSPEYAPSHWLHVCEHKIVVEMPATFNPVAAEIEAIERENEQLRAEFNRQIGRNMERLAKIQALPFEAKEAA